MDPHPLNSTFPSWGNPYWNSYPSNLTYPLWRNAANLNFTNCTEAVYIWTYFTRTSSYLWWVDRKKGRDLDTLATYILHGLDTYLQEYNTEPPNLTSIQDWLLTDPYVEKAVKGSTDLGLGCRDEMCLHWRWQGNSDIAGVGMQVTYIVQAILVTLYILALLAVRTDWVPATMDRLSLLSRTLSAVRHSTSTFLNASFVFSISMLFAALISFARHGSRHGDPLTKSAWTLSMVLPVSSVLPVVLLQLSASDMLRRVQGRKLLWPIVAILISIILSLNMAFPVDTKWYTNDQRQFEEYCLLLGHFPLVAIGLGWAIAVLLVLGIGGYLIAPLMPALRNRSSPFWGIRLSRCLWFLAITTAFCAMWLFLGFFIYFQTYLSKVRAYGDDNKDAEWSFGQILALGTWAPFLVEFGYLWWELPEEALSGRLVDPYEVVKISRKPGVFELKRSWRLLEDN